MTELLENSILKFKENIFEKQDIKKYDDFKADFYYYCIYLWDINDLLNSFERCLLLDIYTFVIERIIDSLNYACVRRFSEIKLRPYNWIYHFLAYGKKIIDI